MQMAHMEIPGHQRLHPQDLPMLSTLGQCTSSLPRSLEERLLTAAPAYPRAGCGPGHTLHRGTYEVSSARQPGLFQVPALWAESRWSMGFQTGAIANTRSQTPAPPPRWRAGLGQGPGFNGPNKTLTDVTGWKGWATAAPETPGSLSLGNSFIWKLWHPPLELTPQRVLILNPDDPRSSRHQHPPCPASACIKCVCTPRQEGLMGLGPLRALTQWLLCALTVLPQPMHVYCPPHPTEYGLCTTSPRSPNKGQTHKCPNPPCSISI